MTALATLEQLSTYLGIDPPLDPNTPEGAQAAMLLEQASEAVRAYCRQTISQVTTTAKLLASRERDLVLPERPVISVDTVEVDGVELEADGWSIVPALGALRRRWADWYHDDLDDERFSGQGARRGGHPGWGSPGRAITVTYTHGYATIPPLIVGIVCGAAARSRANPLGVRSEQLGAYSVTYAGDAGSIGSVTLGDNDMAMLRSAGYRRG